MRNYTKFKLLKYQIQSTKGTWNEKIWKKDITAQGPEDVVSKSATELSKAAVKQLVTARIIVSFRNE